MQQLGFLFFEKHFLFIGEKKRLIDHKVSYFFLHFKNFRFVLKNRFCSLPDFRNHDLKLFPHIVGCDKYAWNKKRQNLGKLWKTDCFRGSCCMSLPHIKYCQDFSRKIMKIPRLKTTEKNKYRVLKNFIKHQISWSLQDYLTCSVYFNNPSSEIPNT